MKHRLVALASALALAAMPLGALSAQAAVSPNVSVSAVPATAGARTTLTYRGTVTRAGRLTSIGLTFPAGTTGVAHISSGTLRGAGHDAMVWTPRRPITVRVGTRLVLPVTGFALPRLAGTYRLGFRAAAGRVVLSAGYGSLAVAPVGPLPPTGPLPVVLTPPPAAGCPTSYPSVAQENALPGTAAWTIDALATVSDDSLAMYADTTSAVCGDTVGLRIKSAKPVTLTAYRMGYYQGLGARKVWEGTAPASAQPAAVVLSGEQVSAKAWTSTTAVPVTKDWTPGVYLIKADDGTHATYAPLTVRDDTATQHALLIQQATATWQAYNNWGGHMFYNGSGALSANRPYADGQGSGQFLPLEQGLIFWAESRGLDATYWTDEDMHRYGSQIAARARTLILPAHDEYYSETMRHALTEAIARGVNVVNLGSNAVYRHITYGADLRTFTLDRSNYPVSTTYRSMGLAWNEQAVLGAQYQCAPHGDVTTNSSWLFAGVPAGTVLHGFMSGENDRVDAGVPQPAGTTVLVSAQSPCRTGAWAQMDTTAFTARSGARVVNGSTFAFSCFLVRRCPANWSTAPSATESAYVSRMMANIVSWVSTGSVPLSTRSAMALPPALRATVPSMTLTEEPGEG